MRVLAISLADSIDRLITKAILRFTLETIRSWTKRRNDTCDSQKCIVIYSRRGRCRDAYPRMWFRICTAMCLGRSGSFGWGEEGGGGGERGGEREGGWSGPRAFTIIHVNCPQHARSCPKSHAPWLHFAAGQTFRTVSESVLRRADSTGHYRLRAANANPFCVRGVRFFSTSALHFASISIFVNLMADTTRHAALLRFRKRGM